MKRGGFVGGGAAGLGEHPKFGLVGLQGLGSVRNPDLIREGICVGCSVPPSRIEAVFIHHGTSRRTYGHGEEKGGLPPPALDAHFPALDETPTSNPLG